MRKGLTAASNNSLYQAAAEYIASLAATCLNEQNTRAAVQRGIRWCSSYIIIKTYRHFIRVPSPFLPTIRIIQKSSRITNHSLA